ncbi:RE1-silencing transcription factor-like [Ruditapes philippinarum]|uniref:RE1-silencing transcription factor-like n=1 Tax=Ruditapes philippinarum TaxID=129788 RepID=UPI00295BE6F4|nr:RE1-silencing transcription factor-like [Ruditapes philippinarum]
MPKVKSTPRKPILCPLCEITIKATEDFRQHVMHCKGVVIKCEDCNKTFKKKVYLQVHKRKFHTEKPPEVTKVSTTENVESSEKDFSDNSDISDWDKDPDIELVEDTRVLDDITLLGRTIRKPTNPRALITPKARSPIQQITEIEEKLLDDENERSEDIMFDSNLSNENETEDVENDIEKQSREESSNNKVTDEQMNDKRSYDSDNSDSDCQVDEIIVRAGSFPIRKKFTMILPNGDKFSLQMKYEAKK